MQGKNIHDKLFKQVFSIASETKAFIRTFISREVRRHLDLDSLTLENTSFINEKLSEYFSDIVWSCGSAGGGEVKISLLLEHKSYTDPLVHFQLLRYLTESYEYQITKAKEEATPSNLSLIIPIVIYHGKKAWKMRKISDLFENLPGEELQKYIPDFAYEVTDIRGMTDEYIDKIEQAGFLRASFYLFRYRGDTAYFLENGAKFFIFDNRLTEREREVILITVIHYISTAFQLSKNQVMTTTNSILQELIKGSDYLPGSAAEQWVEEGRAEGLEQGLEQGKEISARLEAVKSAIGILKKLPALSSRDIAELCSGIKEKEAEKLRRILSEKPLTKAQKTIMKVFFAEMKLTEKDKESILQKIRDYYQPV